VNHETELKTAEPFLWRKVCIVKNRCFKISFTVKFLSWVQELIVRQKMKLLYENRRDDFNILAYIYASSNIQKKL